MIQKKIINLSKDLGIDLIGFVKLRYFKELENILKKQENLNYKTSFQVGNIDDKTFKSDRFKNMNSAIVFGIAYNKDDFIHNNLKDNEVYLSSYCWGEDYHKVLKDKLKLIEEAIISAGGKSKIFVDNNILDEKFLAREAGLGFYGINNILINEKFGSYFFIGVILTDLKFQYSKRNNSKCFGCGRCILACPTGAINESGILNGNKCLSYLTQKRNVRDEEKKYFNKCIYGCDICSRVCPHNNIGKSNNFKFSGIELINSEKFIKLSNEEFSKIYSKNACSWSGKSILDRNIKIFEEKIEKK